LFISESTLPVPCGKQPIRDELITAADHRPARVASWVYVFGVAALAALAVAIVSGFAPALGGADWWHYNPVGRVC
jgi:hypothetical protein